MNSKDFINRLAKELQPEMAYEGGKDIPKWQREAREKLQDLLGLPLDTCPLDFKITKETAYDDYTRYDFTYQSERCATSGSQRLPTSWTGRASRDIMYPVRFCGRLAQKGRCRRSFAFRAIRPACIFPWEKQSLQTTRNPLTADATLQ